MIYIDMAFITIIAAVLWYSRQQVKDKQELETALNERTKEFTHKNQQLEDLEHQLLLLKKQSDELKETDQLKSRFFANISHEFRTPLTLILGLLEEIRFNSGDQEIEKKIKVILQNSRSLLTLINQLLDLSKFDGGKMSLMASYQDIIPFLRAISESFHFFARQNKLDLIFTTDEENIFLYYDTEKIEKAIVNLVANAIKFTTAGGNITIKVSRHDCKDFLKISIADTGMGIPNHQLPHIFDHFYQARLNGSDWSRYDGKGTGIGLALTKELISLHHGRIDVHSTPGKGTEFVIRLPLGNAHLKPQEIVQAPASPDKCRYCPGKDTSTPRLIAEKEKEPEKKDKQKDRAKELILVVDDSADMRQYLRNTLEKQFNVVEAANGEDGILKAKATNPDLVVCDILMPQTDGYEVCRALKNDNQTSQIPFIFLTAKASEESRIYGLESEADDYIIKPFNTRVLSARIKSLLHSRRHLKEKIELQILQHPGAISVSSMDTLFIKEVRDMIEQNLSDPEFNVDQLAGKLYISRSGLYRKLHPLTGQSPVQFIRSYRLQRAAQLLKARFGNVTEVSLEVGFANVAYFSKCFKEQFHQLPSTYTAE